MKVFIALAFRKDFFVFVGDAFHLLFELCGMHGSRIYCQEFLQINFLKFRCVLVLPEGELCACLFFLFGFQFLMTLIRRSFNSFSIFFCLLSGKMASVNYSVKGSYMAAWLYQGRGRDFCMYCVDGREVWAHSEFLRNISRFVDKLLHGGDRACVLPFSSSLVSAAMVYLYQGSVDIAEEDQSAFIQMLSFFDLREFGLYKLLN